MITIKNYYLICLASILVSSISYADDLNKKEVYSYQSNSGTPVFTDKRPIKTTKYNTNIIETSVPSYSGQKNNNHEIADTHQPIVINQTQTVVYSKKNKANKKIKSKDSLKRCQRYKEKLDYYSEKMREGYKNSEYKKLEKNRKKYKNLLFNRCDTKTFSE